MKLTTGFDFQGYFITEYIDVFFDEILFGIGLGKGFISSIDNILSSLSGSEATEMVEKLNDVKSELRRRVITKAQKAGANALIGIDFESSRLGDLLMVSMTATAVKIEKIIDPLPNTEGSAARLQHEKEIAEKERQEAEKKHKMEEERREKIAKGEAYEIDRKDLMQRLKQMDSTEKMLKEVRDALSMDPLLLSDDQMKKLENCNNIARMYGMRTGVKSFVDSIDGFLFSETENE